MNTQANRDDNENMMAVEIELSVEEIEEVIAPGFQLNHNETLIGDSADIELNIEELEELIAPGWFNHNETLISDSAEIELSVEEMEEVIEPEVML
jgi:hypothetical protein